MDLSHRWTIVLSVSGVLIMSLLLVAIQRAPELPGCTGPGGVGDQQAIALWLRPGVGDSLGRHGASAYYPVTCSGGINGRPVFLFDEAQNLIHWRSDRGMAVARTLFMVFRSGVDIDRQQGLYEETDLAGASIRLYIGQQRLHVARRLPGGHDTVLLRCALLPQRSYLLCLSLPRREPARLYLDGQVGGSFAAGLPASRVPARVVVGGILPEPASDPVETELFSGQLGELICYDAVLNDAERHVVETYLAARFGLDIAFDYYPFKGSHGHEVAGLACTGQGSARQDARGTAMLRVYAPAHLDPNEYLFWGHDAAPLAATCPVQVGAARHRLCRTWRFSEIGELGPLSLSFDVSALPTHHSESLHLLIDSGAGDFDAAGTAVHTGSYDALSQMLTFNHIDIPNEAYLTLGSPEVPEAEVVAVGGAGE
ncbi:MAG: hypothetical protein OHK0039_33350 [Bacteroidia bacterium]